MVLWLYLGHLDGAGVSAVCSKIKLNQPGTGCQILSANKRSLQAFNSTPALLAHLQVKPIKMSSAKSKISQDMVAEGPRTEKDLEGQQQQSGKSWWANQLQSVGNSIMNFASGKKTPAPGAAGTDSNAPPPEKVLNDDKQLHPRIKLKERLDFMMKESAMENSYLNSITAHHSYWSSADCAQYVLLQLYKYKPQS